MDYYDLMLHTHRLWTAALAAALLTASATAGTRPVAAIHKTPRPSTTQEESRTAAQDAEIFYEILLGEITTRSGDPSSGYALMLEAARTSNDENIYKRAADIALQARSGEAALAAANAWKDAWPQSREANRYVLQLLVALNRIADTAAPLQQELLLTKAQAKATAFQALPQLYRRASDKALAASVVQQALASDLKHPDTGAAAWATVGRMRILANDKKGALEAAHRAQKFDPNYEGTALLALELMEEGEAEAAPIARQYFDGQPLPALRLIYARVLVDLQRPAESLAQLQAATRENPSLAEGWLMQAMLQIQNKALDQAEIALQQFTAAAQASATDSANIPGMTQAYLLYAQIAEAQGNFEAAEGWLQRVNNPSDVFNAQIRRAALWARQGELTRARGLLHTLQTTSTEEERVKWMAEVQFLRDAGKYNQALALQAQAVAQFPNDNDLLYDQAMLADRAGQQQTMERLLRQLIARQPDYHHAYNALGYSLAERGVRLQEAKELIEKALTYAPDDPFITDSLGWVEFRLGNHAQALLLLERAFEKRQDADIAAHLGEVLWKLGQHERAKALWKDAQQQHPDNETLRETLKRLGVAL
ncbi:MAG: tetratricopeptide repeat protein [Giesbergeria sp.]|nr:tetratricopeptide repeat protein [Giesbergeria sp.]MBP6321319.1 tetratricopeptide repeat protein [Giesbergeria sp.]MBP7916176.1 tetratricopeptide repeat protein [Giesbergeria sp.]MBP8028485.1 tetratricopeptide repeat protein [Giesbergeria sp.]MBP8839086.1 tetratricopeptide repeat protein [Giesbergeria sp.]